LFSELYYMGMGDKKRGWADEECTNVSLCVLKEMGGFRLCLTNCRCDYIDPCDVLLGPRLESVEERKFEHALIHVVKTSSGFIEGGDGWSELGFGFDFSVSGIDAMEVCVP
jgi:hypothetical protein